MCIFRSNVPLHFCGKIRVIWGVILFFRFLCSMDLFYGLLSGLGLLLRMFCFLCLTSAVRNKLYYTGDQPEISPP